MSDIILYGAFDRHNYGDLLFPLVMHRLLSRKYPQTKIIIAGLVQSDLSKYNALPTVGIKKALSYTSNPILILAGGDVVACDWLSAYGYLLPRPVFSLYERFICRFFPQVMTKFVQKLIGLESYMPFNPMKSDINKNMKLIYNSVGATAVSGIKEADEEKLGKALNCAEFLTVRDHFSCEQVRRLNVKVEEVYPDSATVMSSIFSNEEINNKTSLTTQLLIKEHKGKYLVFQISSAHSNGLEKEFAIHLSLIAKQFDIAIVFLAIGNAAGHSDIIGIERINKYLDPHVNVHQYLDGNIFDIMNIIKHASCYCGTSLHGLITSMSFNVPRVGLLPKLRKQQNYMKAWDLDDMPRGVLPENLSDAVNKALSIPKEQVVSVGENTTAKYFEAFERMCKVI